MTLLSSEHSILIRSKFKSVLQLRLQQRRTREQISDQGIMPPLKSPAAFHEQRKNLERSKTGDYLKHKIRSKPEKSELLNMRILQGLDGEGPAGDSHARLKRARLNEGLQEKSSVPENMSPLNSTLQEDTGRVNDGPQQDSYAFEEDSSSESLSPEHSEESLADNKSSGSSSPAADSSRQHGSQMKDGSSQNPEETMTNSLEPPIPVPAIVKSKMSEKNRHKKPKDIKPKVKKLKYHQYIPPDQKAERSPPPQMDSAYARLLQQQQLFLQLQILSQQKQQQHSQTHAQTQQSFSYQTLNQHTHNKQSSEAQAPCSSSVHTSSSSPVKNSYCTPSISPVRPGPLPANLDDLKVSELRQQLRIRGLPVSGTKTALIERLRPFRDSSCASPSGSGDISSATFPVTPSYQSPHGGGFYPFCSSGSTPPISPASSDLSVSGSLPDSFSDVTMSSPQFGLQASPAQLSTDDGQSLPGALGLDAEKDKMLVEKQKVIEELTWKLLQEQRQVEELRMQLHKRKRLQDCPALPPSQHMMHLQPPGQMQQQFYGVSVKQEPVSSSCPLMSKQMKGPSSSCMSHCDPHCLDLQSSGSPAGLSAFLSPQCSPQDSPVTKPSSSPQPASPAHTYLMRDGCPHTLPQNTSRSSRCLQLQQKSAGQSVSCSYASDQRNIQPLYSSPSESDMHHRASAKSRSSSSVQQKQMVRSQQMDELLDVLMESGVSQSAGRFHRAASLLPFESAASHGDAHLEALLSRTQVDAGDLQGFPEKLMMDTPLSPTTGKPAAVETHALGMNFPESPWETMEWLDLTPPSSATAFQGSLPPAGPSIFNTEFLDVADISLNSAMELHLDHW